MRLICGVVGILASAVLAGPLYALGVPTLPTPTLPAPPLPPPPLPPPPLPPLPAPSLPPAPTAPSPPPPSTTPIPLVPAPPAPLTPPPTTAVAQPSSAPGAAGAATPPASSNAAATSAPGAPRAGSTRVGPSRSSGSSRVRHLGPHLTFDPIVKRFRLAHATRVRVTVQEVYPVCKKLRSFVFTGRKGRNTLHLPRRIRARIGAYQVVAHSRGHKLFSVRARVRRDRNLIIDRDTANACAAPGVEAAALTTEVPTMTTLQQHGVASAHESRTALSQGVNHAPRDTNPLVRAITLGDAPASVRPLLFVLLAMSIFLLGTAAMPQTVLPAGPMADALAQRRIYVAAAGIWLLAVVIVVTLIW